MANAQLDAIYPGISGTIYIQPMGGAQVDESLIISDFSTSGGDRDVEEVNTYNDNKFIYTKTQGMMEVSITTVKQDTGLSRAWLGGTDVGPQLFHHSGAMARDSNWRVTASWQFRTGMAASASWMALRMDFRNALGMSRELSCAADGYLEETITFKCRPQDYREEFTNNHSASPIPAWSANPDD